MVDLGGSYIEPQRQDIYVVKCVVVGDTGVGKTRLICAHACGNKYELPQLMQTHVPTVWAIDHYRKDREVLERSWCTVDGVTVSLRIWDTFGYRDKDRRFAYGRADVILCCFSAVRPRSLRSVKNHWIPEIERCCPGVPVVLVACQVDLRYLYLDEHFINLDKGPFFSEIKESDIITPEQGRHMANEVGAVAYYESSVLDDYGINQVFINVTRAALVSRREKHFWNMLGNLKRISRPICQAPFLPPKPIQPPIVVPEQQLDEDIRTLLQNQQICDVIFLAQGVCIPAHKVCLVAASPVFEELFLADWSMADELCHGDNDDVICENIKNGNANSNGNHSNHGNCGHGGRNAGSSRSNSLKKTHASKEKEKSTKAAVSDTVKLLEYEEMETSSVETLADPRLAPGDSNVTRRRILLNLPAFSCIEFEQVDDAFNRGEKNIQTVVTLNDNISPATLQYVLTYLYTGKCSKVSDELLKDVRRAADLMGLRDLAYILTNIITGEGYLNKDVEMHFHERRCQRFLDIFVGTGKLADVMFQVDDGSVSAHKALLMARCDVMLGMFSYNFTESSAKIITFPHVSMETFTALQEFLYTDRCRHLDTVDSLELIELANRLCLPRLLAMTEEHIVQKLQQVELCGREIYEEVLWLIEPAQLHNASQLAAWCLWYVSSHYTTIYRKHSKIVHSLRPDNQVYLSKHRWPPLWYLKEVDYYEKCLVDLERERTKRSYNVRRGSDDCDSGCLGFCSRNRRKLRSDPSPTKSVITML